MSKPMYEKLSDTTFKESKVIEKDVETIYSIAGLLYRKGQLLQEIKDRQEAAKEDTAKRQVELAEIAVLILKAAEIGIVEIEKVNEGMGDE